MTLDIRCTAEIGKLADALAKAQAEIADPTKNKTAKAGSYSYKYADIADVLQGARPVLTKHGLSVIQPTCVADGAMVVVTRLLHSSGQWIEGEYPVCSVQGDHQKMGSALTYARRYALCALIGVAADEDTDGHGAAKSDGPRKSSAQAKRDGDWEQFQATIQGCHTVDEVEQAIAGWKTDKSQSLSQAWIDSAEDLAAQRMAEIANKPPHDPDTGEIKDDHLTPSDSAALRQGFIKQLNTCKSVPDLANYWKDPEAQKAFRVLLPKDQKLVEAKKDELKTKLAGQPSATELMGAG